MLMDLLRRKNSHLYSGRGFLPVYFPWSVQPSCILPSHLTDCHYFSVCWFSNRKNDLILKGLPINFFLNFSLAQEKRPLQYFFIVSVQQKSRTKGKETKPEIHRKSKLFPDETPVKQFNRAQKTGAQSMFFAVMEHRNSKCPKYFRKLK